MSTIIALINACSAMTDADLAAIAAALEIQGQRDLAPAWRLDPPRVVFVPKGQTPPPGAWWLVALDNSDQAGALGYHELTDEGLPIGKAFVGTDLQYGASPSVTLSHEFNEMNCDPDLTRVRQVKSGRVAVEVCDPCEGDQFGYLINKILVSDFVVPAYYEDLVPYRRGIQRFDYGGHITEPMQILSEGYLSIDKGNGWTQINGEKVPHGRKWAPVGSRRERRRRGHEQWACSSVNP